MVKGIREEKKEKKRIGDSVVESGVGSSGIKGKKEVTVDRVGN